MQIRQVKTQGDNMVYEDFANQLSFIEPPKKVEFVRSTTINPRNIGFSNHPLYHVWNSMKQRCHNPNAANYKFYGLRGIKVCERWHDFQQFIEDMGDSFPGKGYHLDRINANLNYEKTNCQWIKASENVRKSNKTRSGTRYIKQSRAKKRAP